MNKLVILKDVAGSHYSKEVEVSTENAKLFFGPWPYSAEEQ